MTGEGAWAHVGATPSLPSRGDDVGVPLMALATASAGLAGARTTWVALDLFSLLAEDDEENGHE